MIRAMLLRESLYAPRIFAHLYPVRFIHQPFRRWQLSSRTRFSRATPLRHAAEFGTIHTEPVKGLYSTREALPMRRGGFSRKVEAPCIL